MKRALTMLLVPLLGGCALTRQVTWSQLTHPDGTTERRKAVSNTYAWGDARQSVAQLKVSNGKTLGIGITDSEQGVTTTNLVHGLSELRQIIQLLK